MTTKKKRKRTPDKLLDDEVFIAMMTTGGRITIPIAVRRKLKLRTDSQVDFDMLSSGRLSMTIRKR